MVCEIHVISNANLVSSELDQTTMSRDKRFPTQWYALDQPAHTRSMIRPFAGRLINL